MAHGGRRLVAAGVLAASLASGVAGVAVRPAAADLGSCSDFYKTATWVVATCATDSTTSLAPMAVRLGDQTRSAVGVQVYYAATPTHVPQVAVFTSDAYLRLKPLDSVANPITFGTSAILGPNYWPAGANQGTHNPDLTGFEIRLDEVAAQPSALLFHLTGTVGALQVTYDLRLVTPTARETRLHVDQHALATSAIAFDSGHVALDEGYKEAAHFSSMFVTGEGPCSDGVATFTRCHDADAVRFLAHDGSEQRRDFEDVAVDSFLFPTAPRLGDHILDLPEDHATTWQNLPRPSLRLLLDTAPPDFSVQGRRSVQPNDNPRDGDNIDVWMQDEARAATGFQAGDTVRIGYTLVAGESMHPGIVQGFTWFADGQYLKSGPRRTVVTAYATDLVPSRSYQLVSGRTDEAGAPCALDVVPVNPTVRRASSTGRIGNTAGILTRPPGTWALCFYEVEPGVRGRVAGAPVYFTVTPP